MAKNNSNMGSKILAGVLVGGAVLAGIGYGGYYVYENYLKDNIKQEEFIDNTPAIIDGEEYNGEAVEAQKNITFRGLSKESNTIKLTATVLPDYAIDKTLNWSLKWKEANGSEVVTDYVSIQVDENTHGATLTYKKVFTKQIILVIESNDAGNAKKEITIDCYTRTSDISIVKEKFTIADALSKLTIDESNKIINFNGYDISDDYRGFGLGCVNAYSDTYVTKSVGTISDVNRVIRVYFNANDLFRYAGLDEEGLVDGTPHGDNTFDLLNDEVFCRWLIGSQDPSDEEKLLAAYAKNYGELGTFDFNLKVEVTETSDESSTFTNTYSKFYDVEGLTAESLLTVSDIIIGGGGSGIIF